MSKPISIHIELDEESRRIVELLENFDGDVRRIVQEELVQLFKKRYDDRRDWDYADAEDDAPEIIRKAMSRSVIDEITQQKRKGGLLNKEAAANPYQQMMEEAYSKMEPLNKQQLDDRAKAERDATSLKMPTSLEVAVDELIANIDTSFQLGIEKGSPLDLSIEKLRKLRTK